ncbi:TonB-dependent receptor [Brenneria goodwinii]|uniref:Iron siderophore receptor protein n=1 Tax=Brenneria goodwinii TaxID=1109412 RepID=A0A0G4JV75_9GAMM|nr:MULTISPECIES: TonB-dependent receptor [Brenneria]CPR16694.1 Iron siderophore receptor protein [Brenneria goodwinii]
MMTNKNKRGARRIALAALLNLGGASLAAGIIQQDAWAQTAQQIEFNVPAGPLAGALAEFGRQSGRQVTYDPGIAAGKRSPGIAGAIAPDAALARLLQGSGLSYRPIGADTYAIEPDVAAAYAQNAGDDSLLLDTITVTGVSGVSPADEPYRGAGSRAYISGEQVERFRGTSVGDFLSGVPGVINGDNRNSGALDVNIRGMQGQGRVPVIVDGASQESSVYRGYNGTASRSYVDPDFIGAVSIEKGPSMEADATGATGGVVRMSTIGVDDILLPGKSFGVRLKGGFNTNSSSAPATGTFGGFTGAQSYTGTMPDQGSLFSSNGMNRPAVLEPTGGSGSIAVAGTTEYVDILAAYARRKNGNYHAGSNGGDSAHAIIAPNQYGNLQVTNGGLSAFRAGEEVLNTSYDNESWLLKGTVRAEGGHSLELGWNRYQSEYGEILPTQLAVNAYAYQGWLNTIELDTYTARYRWSPEDHDLIDLKVDAFRSDVDLRVNAAVRNYIPSLGWDIWMPSRVYIASQRYGTTISNTSRFSTDIGDFKLEYGGAWTREDIGLPDDVDRDTYVGWATREGRRNETSGFTSLEWKPLDWLTFNESLRYSRFETLDDTDSSRHSADGWSPVFSATIEPLQGFQVYGKYGSVLRSPSIFETLKSESFDAGTQNFVNPERARSIEFGINHLQEEVFRAGDKVRLHAAYFDNKIDDYITRANVLYTREDGSTGYRLNRINLDYARMRGFEVSADYDTGNYFGGLAWNHYTDTMFCVAEGTELISGYSRCASGGIQNSYSLLQVPPQDTVTLNLGARLLDEKLTVGGRLTYTGSRMADGIGDGSVIGTGEIQPSRWNPYTLIDLYASYKINNNATVDLTIDNLTDRYYMDALGSSLMPGPGRTVRGGVTVKF